MDMEYLIFAIRDIKSGFNQPWLDVSIETAKRGFAFSMNNGDITKVYPADFQLYCLGKYYTKNGVIEAYQMPQYVCDGAEVVSND